MDHKSPDYDHIIDFDTRYSNLSPPGAGLVSFPLSESDPLPFSRGGRDRSDISVTNTRYRDATGGTALHGVWIKDGGESHYETGIRTFDNLTRIIAAQAQRGFTPVDIVGSGRFFEPWTVAFVKSNSTHLWHTTTDPNEFMRRHAEMVATGNQIIAFNRRHRCFNAVWAPGGTGDQLIKWDLGWTDLIAADHRHRTNQQRIQLIDCYGPSGSLYAAVWAAGDGEQVMEAPGGLNVTTRTARQFAPNRYEHKGLFLHAMGHNGYPVAVFRPSSNASQRRYAVLPPAACKEYDAACKREGYRLCMISHAPLQAG